MIESYRGKPRFAGGCQIPPAALDVQDIQRFAQNVYFAQLDRGISATVQYQRRVASEQLGAIDTQPEFAWMPRGISLFHSPITDTCPAGWFGCWRREVPLFLALA